MPRHPQHEPQSEQADRARDNAADLLHLVNAALQAIPSSEQMTIARRWNAGGVSISGTHQVRRFIMEYLASSVARG